MVGCANSNSGCHQTTATRLGVVFCPLLPYSLQENNEAERLNRTLGDMARAMVVQSQMLSLSQVLTSSGTIRAGTIHHYAAPSWRQCYSTHTGTSSAGQAHTKGNKLQAVETADDGQLAALGPKHQQNGAVSKCHFPPVPTIKTGCLTHIMNAIVLDKVPTERYFEEENQVVSSLPLVKDVKIPSHLGQVLNGPDGGKGCVGRCGKRAMNENHWALVVF
ncbi:hypothetical protein O181_067691 [Austropuccinia psidii MF-1]|uniref:Uncharacterized protein n=1 Tax=Austropuccinia psidii MF-1 TaxID=1389203 RepID=A0A9Q3F058_9BASI|nr:hypothetical protein [Austropuccinia psidii MF-1]